MKVYVDLEKQLIEKVETKENEVYYVGDNLVNVLEVIVTNVNGVRFYPTLNLIQANQRNLSNINYSNLESGKNSQTYTFNLSSDNNQLSCVGRLDMQLMMHYANKSVKCVGTVSVNVLEGVWSGSNIIVTEDGDVDNVVADMQAQINALQENVNESNQTCVDKLDKENGTADNLTVDVLLANDVILNNVDANGVDLKTSRIDITKAKLGEFIDGEFIEFESNQANVEDEFLPNGIVPKFYIDWHKNDFSNPHKVSKGQVGLGNVDNTSDINKPVSTKQQSAIDKGIQVSKDYADTKDNNLQEQIDAINNSQNLVDIVANYTELMALDTSEYENGDKVQVIDDETHDDKSTIYSLNNGLWVFVGAFGNGSYTKAETNKILEDYVKKQIGMGLSSNDFTNTYKDKLDVLHNYDDTYLINTTNTLLGNVSELYNVTQNLENQDEEFSVALSQTKEELSTTKEALEITQVDLHNTKLQLQDLRNTIYGYVVDATDVDYTEIDSVVLDSSVTIGDNVYPASDNTRLGLVSVEGLSKTCENLINLVGKEVTTINGVVYSVKNEAITFNGTATATFSIWINISLITLNGNYYYKPFTSGTYNGTIAHGFRYNKTQNNINLNFNYALLSNQENILENSILVYIVEGATFNNFSFKPMLVSGSIAPTTFVPYYEGIKSTTFAGIEVCGTQLAFDKVELLGVGTAHDTLSFPKTNVGYNEVVERKVGTRAYQSGDESNSEVITDGTITYYKLPTTTTTALATNLTYAQVTAMSQNGGTMQVVGNDNVDFNVKPNVTISRVYRLDKGTASAIAQASESEGDI